MNYGTGHPGTSGTPSLTATAPLLNGTSTLTVDDTASGKPTGLLAYGFAPNRVVSPAGATLLVSIFQSFPVPLTPPTTGFPLAFPTSPALCDTSLYLQLLQVDSGAAGGTAYSQGLRLTLGN